ncbi:MULTISPECIES: ABC transporter permease [Roseovarius]|uniref:ABC transporter permease n=1 Tax=Roseovarius TaxID=74030 RepID=UPI001C98CD89|nr:ABC transporter permease [Roseovarius atlanticus]MBY5989157.1 ABC transporter permease [Roseovarius atlanticus]MBY6124549.1 ABC transporter permease [Roseovarius atlanticus]MBY6149044.1 ABC transporter permease [Roseovarius atlanticus]
MRRFARKYLNSLSGTAGLAIFTLALLAAVFAPLFAGQNPYDLGQLSILDSRLPPGSVGGDGQVFWLGTDDQGRDLVSAILYGLRISLTVAIVATAFALVIGAIAGLLAAQFGGVVDAILMRMVDLQFAFPGILIALVLLAVLGTGLDKVIIAIAAVQWAYYARVVRGSAMIEKNKEYVEATKVLRFPALRVMWRHLLPNSSAPLMVVVVVEMASAIALEATLSFLGVGLPITQPSLGLLIANGYGFMLTNEYWLSLYPGLVLLVLLISVNLIGERLRQMNDVGESR